jgi:putative peptidoglycan lipid II flippase
MNLARALTTIGSWTLISRVLGFVRDTLIARYLGAGFASDCFNAAFVLPNLFRSLFAEGAFSAAFVPAFAKRMREAELEGKGGLTAAGRFAEDVLAIFVPVLLLFTALAQVFMPWIAGALFDGFKDIPGKLDFTTHLSRITFPYLMLISLAALVSGILNSLSRFAAAAATPIFLNLCLIGAVLLWRPEISPYAAKFNADQMPAFLAQQNITATAQAVAVSVAGVLQFGWLLWACKRAGVPLRLRLPKLTPEVKALLMVILPATLGAGVYQISIFINRFFASHLPEGSLSHMFYADRLNQLPLGVVGIALGTAILPSISKFVAAGDTQQASNMHNRAAEIAMLVCLPATVALIVCALPLTQTLFQRGAFSLEDSHQTSLALAGMVAGLPAYVLIRVLTPGFFARGDTKTPVKTAAVSLLFNLGLNLALMNIGLGVLGLSLATAFAAWINCILLYVILHRNGHVRADARFLKRLVRQIIASLCMGALVWAVLYVIDHWFVDVLAVRISGLAILVFIGMLGYFVIGGIIGAYDKDQLLALARRKPKATDQ